MSAAIFYTLLAFHAGNVYAIDTGLSGEDCLALREPGSIEFFEGANGETITPNASTQFECTPDAPSAPPTPETNEGAASRLMGTDRPRVTQYGDDRRTLGEFVALNNAARGVRQAIPRAPRPERVTVKRSPSATRGRVGRPATDPCGGRLVCFKGGQLD